MVKSRLSNSLCALALLAGIVSCENYRKDDYHDNSPTSGQLRVYYDEGLQTHVQNQVLTFESQYPKVEIQLHAGNDEESVKALLHDSAQAIVISRLLSADEQRLFASRTYTPDYSLVAYSGIALITNTATPLKALDVEQIRRVLVSEATVNDSTGKPLPVRVVIDRNNSSVMRYLIDSLMKTPTFAGHCSSLGSTPETISYVSEHRDVIGIIDFAWISDRDDEQFKRLAGSVRLLAVGTASNNAVQPDQSSFKLSTYPLRRAVYVMRNTGEFTLAKGFESFVAGPKGQLTFLKQGLLPSRQAERRVEIKMEPMETGQ